MADLGSTFPTLEDLFGTGIPFLEVGTALLFTLPQVNYTTSSASRSPLTWEYCRSRCWAR